MRQFRAAPESEARLKARVKAGKIDLVVPYQLDSLEGAQGQLKAVTVARLATSRDASVSGREACCGCSRVRSKNSA